MKTIKYLSDGTVAKVGMRVEDTMRVLNFGTGTIVAIRSNYVFWDGQTLNDGILIKPDLAMDTELYIEAGMVWSDPKYCTPIK